MDTTKLDPRACQMYLAFLGAKSCQIIETGDDRVQTVELSLWETPQIDWVSGFDGWQKMLDAEAKRRGKITITIMREEANDSDHHLLD